MTFAVIWDMAQSFAVGNYPFMRVSSNYGLYVYTPVMFMPYGTRGIPRGVVPINPFTEVV